MESSMPRRSRGPHLYLKQRSDGRSLWYIRDGGDRISTNSYEADARGAEAALERHLAQKRQLDFGEGDPSRVKVADVIALYSRDKASGTAAPDQTLIYLNLLNDYFGHRS